MGRATSTLAFGPVSGPYAELMANEEQQHAWAAQGIDWVHDHDTACPSSLPN